MSFYLRPIFFFNEIGMKFDAICVFFLFVRMSEFKGNMSDLMPFFIKKSVKLHL